MGGDAKNSFINDIMMTLGICGQFHFLPNADAF
jgi:hypothetical protein